MWNYIYSFLSNIKNMVEKIITINLRKKLIKSPKWKRSSFLSKLLFETIKKRTHKDNVIIDQSVSKEIWSRGIKNPPTKLKLKISEEDDKAKVELLPKG